MHFAREVRSAALVGWSGEMTIPSGVARRHFAMAIVGRGGFRAPNGTFQGSTLDTTSAMKKWVKANLPQQYFGHCLFVYEA